MVWKRKTQARRGMGRGDLPASCSESSSMVSSRAAEGSALLGSGLQGGAVIKISQYMVGKRKTQARRGMGRGDLPPLCRESSSMGNCFV
jgi:hypothetical protein